MNSIILKLIKSSFIPKGILVLLLATYLSVDDYFDQNSIDPELSSATQYSYSSFLKEEILELEDGIFEDRLGGVRKKGMYDDYFKVSKFYYGIQSKNELNTFRRLSDVIGVLHPWHRGIDDIVHTKNDQLDRDQLYVNYLISQSYGRHSCGPSYSYKIHTEFDSKNNAYRSQMVKTIMPRRYVLSYNGKGYQMTDDPISIKFDKEDIEQGYADVLIRDRFTNKEFQHRIKISRYAFRA